MKPMVRTFILAMMLIVCTTLGGNPDRTATADQINIKGRITRVVGNENDGTPRVDQPEVVIKAPASVRVGDMIIVDLSKSIGDGFDMIIIPEPPQVKVFDNGKVVVTASGYKSADYLFIVSCALNGKSDVKTHVVHVVGPEAIKPINPGEDIIGKVQRWCEDVNSPTPRDDAMKLAQSFASLSTVIDNGSFKTPNEIVSATKISNRDALGDNLQYWVPILDGLMNELKAMAEMGMLPDAVSHGSVWRSVSEGLRTYAEQLAG
jgi:hypothetical protein